MNDGPGEPRRYARYQPWLVIGSLVLGLTIGASLPSIPPSAPVAALVDAADIVGTV